MLRLVPPLTTVFVAVLATAAMATPTPSFTVSDAPTVGIPVTFDATATVCDAEPCGYTWRIDDGSRLGITFGRTPVATYTFDEPGLAHIRLRVVNSNPRDGGPSPREASTGQVISVAPATAPQCPDASLTTRPGVAVALPGDACTHPAGNPNDVVEAPAPAHGQVVAGSYVPEPGFHGRDEFTYRVADRVTGERSNAATVRVLVDTEPDCADIARTAAAGQPLALTDFPPCRDPDGDPLSLSSGDPQHGTLVRDGDTGRASYVPAPGFAGTDTIAYRAVDAFGLTSRAGTLTIAVTGAGGGPGGPPGSVPPESLPPLTGSGSPASLAPLTAPGSPRAADTTPPAFTIAAGGARRTARGLRFTLTASEAGTARIAVTVDRATARRLKVARRPAGRVRVGSLTTRVRRGSHVVVVRLRAGARRALRSAAKVRLRVAVRITDAAGNRSSTRTATVTLRSRRPG